MFNNPRKVNKIEKKTSHLKSLNTKKTLTSEIQLLSWDGNWYKFAETECDRFHI